MLHDDAERSRRRPPCFRSSRIEEAVGRRQRRHLYVAGWRGRSSASAVLGMDALGDQDLVPLRRDAHGHEHRLGHGAAAVVKAGVGDVQAGELADERLELEERLQAALAGLGLVGRVGGVELAAAGDGIDDGGNEVVVAAAAEEADRVVRRSTLLASAAMWCCSSISLSAGGTFKGRLNRSDSGMVSNRS